MFFLSLKFYELDILEWILALFFLVPQAIYDIKNKYICVIPNIVVIFALQFFMIDGNWTSHMSALILGLIFIILSLLFKDSVGMGDGIVSLGLGSIVGCERTFEMLFYASVISSLVSIVLVSIGKANRKTRLPFVPFIMAGMIVGGFI